MATPYNPHATRYVPPWEQDEGTMPQILRERLSQAGTEPVQDIAGQVRQDFPTGLAERTPEVTQEVTEEVTDNPDEVAVRFKNIGNKKNVTFPLSTITAKYNDPILQLRDRYFKQAMEPQAQGYSEEYKNKVRDAGSLRDLFASLQENANQIGNYRGTVAKTNVPAFAEKLNQQEAQDIAQKQATADAANKLQESSAQKYLQFANAPYEQEKLISEAATSGINASNKRYSNLEPLEPEIAAKVKNLGLPLMDKPTLDKMAMTSPIYKMILDENDKARERNLQQQKINKTVTKEPKDIYGDTLARTTATKVINLEQTGDTLANTVRAAREAPTHSARVGILKASYKALNTALAGTSDAVQDVEGRRLAGELEAINNTIYSVPNPYVSEADAEKYMQKLEAFTRIVGRTSDHLKANLDKYRTGDTSGSELTSFGTKPAVTTATPATTPTVKKIHGKDLP